MVGKTHKGFEPHGTHKRGWSRGFDLSDAPVTVMGILTEDRNTNPRRLMPKQGMVVWKYGWSGGTFITHYFPSSPIYGGGFSNANDFHPVGVLLEDVADVTGGVTNWPVYAPVVLFRDIGIDADSWDYWSFRPHEDPDLLYFGPWIVHKGMQNVPVAPGFPPTWIDQKLFRAFQNQGFAIDSYGMRSGWTNRGMSDN